MRFATAQGFNSGDQFFAYLKDSFDVLYREGQDGHAKLLNIGLHCLLAGRPGRIAALERFLDHVQAHPSVWIARRAEGTDEPLPGLILPNVVERCRDLDLERAAPGLGAGLLIC
jgi:peptidoglycan/xylan/chitin deacetylase (PgdA/CDA1 family)